MKLKYLEVNGFGVLVDEDADIKEGNYVYRITDKKIFRHDSKNYDYNINNHGIKICLKIIFAFPELNLDVPILPNWREWEVEQEATKRFPECYNYNKYTEEDMKEFAIYCSDNHTLDDSDKHNIKWFPIFKGGKKLTMTEMFNNFIQSMKKVPKYIVMESEFTGGTYGHDVFVPKLATTPDGKKSGIIKEVIY